MEHLNPALWLPSFILLALLTTKHGCSSSSATFSGNETDRMSLLDIKLQMSDPNGFLNSWNDSQHHCQWPGVGCGVRHRRVTALNLQGKILSGTISPHIGNLSFINRIHLGGNLFHGAIPQQLGQLSRLRFLNLSYNFLTEEIPNNLTRCSQLRSIDLARNRLTGNIPIDIGSLTKLELFVVSRNLLTGRIPASLGNLSSSISVIGLNYNHIEGYVPNELGSLSQLVYLGLGPNKLRGEIPSSVFNLSRLTSLSITENFFSGKLPFDLGLNLPNLQILAIGGNQFSGEIPISITNCTYLKIFETSGNNFEGKIPPDIGKLLNLQLLNLEQNSLSGNVQDILVSLTNCTNLIVLSLSNNNISGELSNTIGNMSSQLTTLYLSFNKISGTIPIELGNLVSLNAFVFEVNFLTGVIPKNLANLQNVERFSLSNNMLSGHIPPALCNNMTNLYGLGLHDNNFGGDLSYSLANCHGLQELYVYGNNFSGIIPSRIFGSYISPTTLDLSNNSLSGTLPLEVGKLVNLQVLDVSHNNISGHIPSTIGDCSTIARLDMHNNYFSGSLPPSLSSLKGIEYLDLSDNTLTGPIISGLSRLVYLKYLNLSYNDLQGEVPSHGVFTNISQIMLEGNNKLCGGIYELGLPACPMVHRKTRGDKHLKIILIPLLLILALSISLFLYLVRRKKSVQTGTPLVQQTNEMLRVSYHDLYQATDEFSPANLIGSGSFGFVYKGNLVVDHREIKVVAVKVLDHRMKWASKSFNAECKALSNLRHRNVVPLLTYCSSIDHKGDEFKALVYKYMENGSLDTWLQPDHPPLKQPKCLNLLQRIHIAEDIALALDHLHNHSHVAVAHCDVKPSNILLDNDFTAYVGDFGLARFLPQLQQGASSSTLAIKGTIGYAAPEYAMGLEVSTKGDVYSYGTLLLEMFTGRRPTNDAFTEGLDLHSYVKAGLSNQVWDIVDPSLLLEEAQIETFKSKEHECIISTLKLGIGCSQTAPKDRMDMKQVIRELHFIKGSLRLC